MSAGPLDHVRANVEAWEARGDEQAKLARRQWAAPEPTWGVFAIPESVAKILPPRLEGARTAELGCGTGYVSAWLARRGALPVGVDPAAGQLRIARQCQDEFGLRFPLVRAAGEQVPLRDAAFDLVISEYGAAIWADPYLWIPEAARLLRRGGELVFLGNSTLLMLCAPDEDGVVAAERLCRPQFGMYRFEWPDDPTVEFHLGHGDWIRLLRANGFEVEDLIELRPAAGTTSDWPLVDPEWARRWPCEEAWRARLR
ncbi:MAG: class I SAM-dependent methyltransferase [Acidimicrobiales bacterium]|jgi:SAM-dependent methyltransferase